MLVSDQRVSFNIGWEAATGVDNGPLLLTIAAEGINLFQRGKPTLKGDSQLLKGAH